MNKQRFQSISDTLMDFALGIFDSKTETSFQSDEIGAILTGLHMLGEELKSTTISLNYFNNIFHSVSDMIFVLNLDGTIKSINNSVKQALSCSEDEIINTSIEKLFPVSKNKLFQKISDQLKNDCKIVSATIQMQCKNASIETQCLLSPLYSEKNKNIGFLLIARDVQKLKESETKYQKIFQDSSDVIFIMDKDYQLLEINKAGKRLLNLKNGLPTIFDLFAKASEKTNFERALKKNNSIKNVYAKLKSKQNKQIDCLISVNRVEGNSGTLQGIIKDISFQKAIETVLNGQQYYSPNVAIPFIKRGGNKNIQTKLAIQLTKRELEILEFVADEYTNDEIAEKLFLAKATINEYRQNLLTKFEAKNTAGLIRKATKLNLI